MRVPPANPVGQNAQDRLDQAAHNYRLYQQLLADGVFLDWALTALFYSALHLVNAHAIEVGKRDPDSPGSIFPGGHSWSRPGGRGTYVRSLPSIKNRYSALSDLSRQTRYELTRPTASQVRRWHDRHYVPLRAWFRDQGLGFDKAPADEQEDGANGEPA